jgi:hypothetical protein
MTLPPPHIRLKNLITIIRGEFTLAQKLVNDIEALTLDVNENAQDEGLVDHRKEELDNTIRGMCIKLSLALTYAEAIPIVPEFHKTIAEFGKINNVAYDGYYGCIYSPQLGILRQYFDAIESAVIGTDALSDITAYELQRLEVILRSTAKIIFDSQTDPHNESVVRQVMFNYLLVCYPDVVREMPIPQVFKSYKADIGIRSLKVAIEYKFADTLDEIKSQIGEIYEDVHGYEDSDLHRFYAVFYTTQAFATQEQLYAAFDGSKVPKNWVPILITGSGSRRRASAPKSIPSKSNTNRSFTPFAVCSTRKQSRKRSQKSNKE